MNSSEGNRSGSAAMLVVNLRTECLHLGLMVLGALGRTSVVCSWPCRMLVEEGRPKAITVTPSKERLHNDSAPFEH